MKPGNLLVTPDGRTKITDLGLAWFLMEELEAATPAGKSDSLVGTADYLAPETIRQPDKILPVSDVYSLGCTLYYAVTGKVPFPGRQHGGQDSPAPGRNAAQPAALQSGFAGRVSATRSRR